MSDILHSGRAPRTANRGAVRMRGLCAAVLLVVAGLAQAQSLPPRDFDIPAGSLIQALDRFGEQSGLQVAYDAALLQGKSAPSVRGRSDPAAVLARLLQGSGLSSAFHDERTVVIRQETPRAPARSEPRAALPRAGAEDERVTGMPAILVKGQRTLNMDIERTVDDPQPYVILDRVDIERSGAVNLNDFLKKRLTMNTASLNNAQAGHVAGDISSVNLRGLGETQTLILIDGRRAARTSSGFSAGQTDLNGIPLAAIERIEVLPTTASAIYGGAATGGVINIIMRRDFIGTEATLTYDNSFDTDSAIKRVDFASGFSLFEGRTSVLLSGSWSEANSLLVKDRDLVQRGRELRMANNPTVLAPGSFPPAGGAANIRSLDGSPLVMKDGTPLGASFTSAPVGYAGVASDGGAALLANAGRYNLDLSEMARLGNAGGNSDFSTAPRVKNLSGSVRHEFSDKLSGFLELSHSENNARRRNSSLFYGNVPASSPNNPFQQTIVVVSHADQLLGYSESESVFDRAGAGLIYQLPGDWVASFDYTLSRAEISYVDNTPFLSAAFTSAINSGGIDLLRDPDLYGVNLSPYMSGVVTTGTPITSTNRNPALRLAGPIGSWKAGRPYLSFLLERQEMDYSSGSQISQGGTRHAYFPERYQNIDSAYVELRLPLLSAAHGFRWVDELELQVAGRWDRYKSQNANYVIWLPPAPLPPADYVFNEVEDFNPLVALKYRPNDSLMIRASYGTGFIPPEINQLTMPTFTQAVGGSWVDPRRGFTGSTGPYEYITGGNPNLQPESSTNWSVGMVFTPSWIEGLRVSLDYTRIEKQDNITTLTDQQILDNEAFFPERISRGPKLPTDPADWAGPVTRMDRTSINSASAELESYDLQLDYTLYTPTRGEFAFFALGTWQTRFDTRVAASLPIVDNLGVASFSSIPLDFKGNVGVVWSYDRWSLGWTTRFTSSYYVANPDIPSSLPNLLAQGNGGRVPSQTYHDAFARYRFATRPNASGPSRYLLDGLELQVGVRNIFNTRPAYDVSNGYHQFSYFGDPRLASYYVSLKQTF